MQFRFRFRFRVRIRVIVRVRVRVSFRFEFRGYAFRTKLYVVHADTQTSLGSYFHARQNEFESSSVGVGLDPEAAVETLSADSIVTKVRPHMFFVMVDDMGMNDVGYSSIDLRGVTPYIDELAAGGIKLSRYYSMHICSPARSAFLTAKYPSNIGMQFENIKVCVISSKISRARSLRVAGQAKSMCVGAQTIHPSQTPAEFTVGSASQRDHYR